MGSTLNSVLNVHLYIRVPRYVLCGQYLQNAAGCVHVYAVLGSMMVGCMIGCTSWGNCLQS